MEAMTAEPLSPGTMPILGVIQNQHAALWEERCRYKAEADEFRLMAVQHELLIRELTARVAELERLLGW